MGCSFSAAHSPKTPTTTSSTISFRTMSPTRSSSLASKILDLDSGNSSDILDLERMRSLLEEYMATEDRIQGLETTNPVTVFYVKKSQLDQIETKIKYQLVEIEALKHIVQSKREKRSSSRSKNRIPSPSLRITNTSQHTVLNVLEGMGEKKINKEEQDILTTINKLEIATTELEMLYQERALHGDEVAALYGTLSQLSEEYKKQDSILEQLGIDASFNEDAKEEAELVDLESRRVTISETYERWKEARGQLIQICGQFSMVLTNMYEASATPTDDVPVVTCNGRGHYEIGEEIRDRLVSIFQGIHNVKFLVRIDLPYCADAEVLLLQKAMTYLFIDLRTKQRRQHARDCYAAFHHRAIALLTWIDKTIGTAIEPALELKTKQIQEKVHNLSQLRLQKICKQFPDLYGKRRHQLRSPTPCTASEEKMSWESTLQDSLDPTSTELLKQIDLDMLIKVPDEVQLFESDNQRKTELNDDTSAILGHAIINSKDRTNRFTRKASMDNLTQMLVSIN